MMMVIVTMTTMMVCDGKYEEKCIYHIYSLSSLDILSGGEREKLSMFLNILLRQSGKHKEAESLTFNPAVP